MLIKNCRCFNGIAFLKEHTDILIKNGKIFAVAKNIDDEDEQIFDAKGKIACPGFIDIHTHGIGGYDNSKINEDDFLAMKKIYNIEGTSVFYPSFPTISSSQMVDSLKMYLKKQDQIPGIHLEGPYINIEKRGAQNPVYIEKPNSERFDKNFGAFLKIIKRITIAPEMDDNFSFTKYLIKKGIKISFGHTVCDTDMAIDFFNLTDSIATHTFNAMPAIHHRKPSITTVALNRENVYCEIIPDLIHLHPEIIKMIFKLKGPGKTISVSDSMLASGLQMGNYNFSGLQVNVDKSGARLDSGALAGSIITLAAGVKNLLEIGIKPEYALMSATSTPANAMGIEKQAGFIKKNMTADINILNHDYTIANVISKGSLIV